MGAVFGGADAAMSGIGPLANPTDYTAALGTGMGPVASGQQYGQFLQLQNASPAIGPFANPTDYTKALGYQGMGPVASGEQYGKFLEEQQAQQPQGPSNLNKGLGLLNDMLADQNQNYRPMDWMPMPGARAPIQLQQSDLLSYLSSIGGGR